MDAPACCGLEHASSRNAILASYHFLVVHFTAKRFNPVAGGHPSVTTGTFVSVPHSRGMSEPFGHAFLHPSRTQSHCWRVVRCFPSVAPPANAEHVTSCGVANTDSDRHPNVATAAGENGVSSGDKPRSHSDPRTKTTSAVHFQVVIVSPWIRIAPCMDLSNLQRSIAVSTTIPPPPRLISRRTVLLLKTPPLLSLTDVSGYESPINQRPADDVD